MSGSNYSETVSSGTDVSPDFHGNRNGSLSLSRMSYGKSVATEAVAQPAPGPQGNTATSPSPTNPNQVHGGGLGSMKMSEQSYAMQNQGPVPKTVQSPLLKQLTNSERLSGYSYANNETATTTTPAQTTLMKQETNSERLSSFIYGNNDPAASMTASIAQKGAPVSSGEESQVNCGASYTLSNVTYGTHGAGPAQVLHGNAVGAVALSEKLVDRTDASVNSMAAGVQKMSLPVGDDTHIDEILVGMAQKYAWTADELKEDMAVCRKYRLKTAKQARDMSLQAWNEMTDILPTTKDLIRQAVGWSAPEPVALKHVTTAKLVSKPTSQTASTLDLVAPHRRKRVSSLALAADTNQDPSSVRVSASDFPVSVAHSHVPLRQPHDESELALNVLVNPWTSREGTTFPMQC
ncbi:hypothetical protein BC830DRAFT_1228137 [Chytriomyces sp. MP71]|nr:hypothetical protein BC830DRAFT_1228137 [Chytriomyces sp. MP71]